MTTAAIGRSRGERSGAVVEASALGRDFASLPLPVWGAILSCLSMIVGWNWDISWHRSIGRDTVWTLAHIAIYVALFIAFAYNAALILSHTFGPLRSTPGIRIFGFKGPSAAFVTLWGLLLQFAAIVFDNWWHDVYGLDVNVFSPPHGLLTWGITIFYIGQFAMVALWRNTGGPAVERRSRVVSILVWGLLFGHISIAPDPSFGPMAVRSVFFVATTAMAFPFALVFLNAYLGRRYASVLAALCSMAMGIILMQVFQLFPATPQFGPVYHKIPHFLPPPFPMLLAVPAAAMGWILPGDQDRFSPKRYVAAAGVFMVVFTVTNWTMSAVLLSPAEQSRFFGGGGFPGTVFEQGFRPVQPLQADLTGLLSVGVGTVLAVFYLFVGHRGGRWLRQVVR